MPASKVTLSVLAIIAMFTLSVHGESALQWPVQKPVIEATSDLLQHLTAVTGSLQIGGEKILEPRLVRRFYMRRNYKPAWLDQNGVFIESRDLLEALGHVELEGLGFGTFHRKTIERRLAAPVNDVVQLAHLDLLLTDAFFHYARLLRYGHKPPALERDLPRQPVTRLVDVLERALDANSLKSALDSMPPPYQGYRKLRLKLARYQAVARRGGWPTIPDGPTLKRGSYGERVSLLRWHLITTGDLSEKRGRADDGYFGRELEKAVRLFQGRHGLEPDGRVGENTLAVLNVPVETRVQQLELNMERWRWLPHEPGERFILINAAAFELSVYENGQSMQDMRVIVGQKDRPTPEIISKVVEIVLNPYWYVPESVLEEDLLPEIRRNPGLLKRQGLKVLTNLANGGQVLDPASIQWKRFGPGHPFPYTLRQTPGPLNPLGRVKFLLPNAQEIYLHDTPEQYLFRRSERTLSSGCVRLDEPMSLATYLLKPNGWSARQVRQVANSGKTQHVMLARPIPIFIGYWTAWVNELNELHYAADVYGRDGHLLDVLRGEADMAGR